MEETLTGPLDQLKTRELEILDLMGQGMTNREIGEHLHVTKETVRWYNKQIYSKLGTNQREEAVALARKLGLLNRVQTEHQSAGQSVSRLPATVGPFIGRDREMADLKDLLAKSDLRLISIVAAGGMGKSRLSIELGHRLHANFKDGLFFIDLTAVRQPEHLADVVINTLGLNPEGNSPSKETLLAYCRAKTMLLIFDNFEHLLPSASFLIDLLHHAPNLKIIVTSRERLNLRVETLFPLHPVTKKGAQLFLAAAETMHPSVVFDDAEKEQVDRLAKTVGGLPLALILAASWVDSLSVAEICDEIGKNIDFLDSEMSDVPPRQRSILAMFGSAWQRLSQQEQEAFSRAAVFRGSFSRPLFQHVTGGTIKIFRTLQQRSLINLETTGPEGGRRFSLHPLMHQFACEKLQTAGNLTEAKQAHLSTYINFATTKATAMYTGAYLQSLAQLSLEEDNFLAALDFAFGQTDETITHQGMNLLLSLCDFWSIRSKGLLILPYLERALEIEKGARLYYWASIFYKKMGQDSQALLHLERAIVLGYRAEDPWVLARAFRQRAFVNSTLNRETIFTDAQLALRISAELDDIQTKAVCHHGYATVQRDFNPKQAIYHGQTAQTFYTQIGDLRGLSTVTHNLVLAYAKVGEIELAKSALEQNLTLCRQLGKGNELALGLALFANWHIVEGAYNNARQKLRESQTISEMLGLRSSLLYSHYLEAGLAVASGHFAETQAVCEQALSSAIEGVDDGFLEAFHSLYTLAYLMDGNAQAAHSHQKTAFAQHNPPISGWLGIIAHAHALELDKRFDQLLPMMAILSQHPDPYTIEQLFCDRLIKRVREQVGETAWQAAFKGADGLTIEDAYQLALNQ
ncbi:MAG: LuxR C-terminal-related transcriptional regulator [Chloroflexota bacterium]